MIPPEAPSELKYTLNRQISIEAQSALMYLQESIYSRLLHAIKRFRSSNGACHAWN